MPIFSPNFEAGSNVWTDLTTLANVYSTVHNGVQDGSLCQPGNLGQTLDSMEARNPIPSEQGTHIIILCDDFLTTGSQPSVSALNSLGGAAGLHPGKMIDDVVYAFCIASVLLHELMHVTQSSSCKCINPLRNRCSCLKQKRTSADGLEKSAEEPQKSMAGME